jgi:putative tricarboxylic transport membrane protein
VCIAITLLSIVPGARAQSSWKPDKALELIVESSPGAGVDRTARIMQLIMQNSDGVRVPVNVVNKPGGGGNIAYQYLQQFPGDAHYAAMATATLLTNHILGVSTFNFTDFSPLGILYGEHVGFAVNAEGPMKSGRDLIERMKREPEKVTFAFGTSRGNANHIAIASVLKAAGIDPKSAKIVLYKASVDAATALMGGHVDVVATPISTFMPLMASGKLRLIAIAAPQRSREPFATVPTWREQGVDAVVPSYRMLLGARGLSAAQLGFWNDVLRRISQSDAWKAELTKNAWEDVYMPAGESVKYLNAQYAQYRAMLVELGLAK